MARTYVEATELVREKLRTEAFPVGGTISIVQIQEIAEVSHNTAATVLRQLASQGEVRIRSGNPSVVLAKNDPAELALAAERVTALLDRLDEAANRATNASARALEANQRVADIRKELAEATRQLGPQ